MATPRCSECPNKLLYPTGEPKPAGTKTCSVKCRSTRARRLKREAKERGGKGKLEAHAEAVRAIVRDGEKDALHEAAVDEFRPLVREAMTAAVLRSIDVLIQQTPAAVARLAEDLDHPDPTIRQRAYTLYLKYTLGNPSVAPPSQQAAPGGLTVQFNIPRPGDDPAAASSITADAAELRTCDTCNTEKPASEFEGASNRCGGCFDSMGSMLAERFGDAYKP
jgi:hypothetical protein